MSDSIPDLWPDEYSERVTISPEQVLKIQADRLAARNPHLTASIKRTEGNGLLTLEFMLSLADGSRVTRLCSLYHSVDQCYPVRLNAEGFGNHVANTQQQFVALMAEVLRNPLVRSGVESLLVAANARQAAQNGSSHAGKPAEEQSPAAE